MLGRVKRFNIAAKNTMIPKWTVLYWLRFRRGISACALREVMVSIVSWGPHFWLVHLHCTLYIPLGSA